MRLRTSSEVVAIKDARNAEIFGFEQIQDKRTDIEDNEDKGTERKLKVKMLELESKNGVLSLDKDEDLLSLTEKLYIIPSLWKMPKYFRSGRGLDQFHVKTLKGTTYKGDQYTQMQEDQVKVDSDSDIEEEKECAVKSQGLDNLLEDSGDKLTELLENLHVTK